MLRRSLLFAVVSSLLITTSAFAQWDFTKITGWSSAAGSDIVYKSNGYPAVAYLTTGSTCYIYVAQWNGYGWNISLLYSRFGYTLSVPKIMVTSDNVLFVMFWDGAAGGYLRLYRVGSGQVFFWSNSYNAFNAVMDPASTGSNYTIHFVYRRTDNGLYYRKYPSPNTDVLVEASAYPGKIVLDNTNHLHMVFNSTTGQSMLKYAYHNGSVWTAWPIEPRVWTTTYSLVVDNNDAPILYARTGSSPNYTVKQIIIER